MTNALIATFGMDNILDRMDSSEADVQQHGKKGFGAYVTFQGTGTVQESPWFLGKVEDGNHLHPDNIYVVNPTTMRHGWGGFDGQPRKPPKLFLSSWADKFPEKPNIRNTKGEEFLNIAYAFTMCVLESPDESMLGAELNLSISTATHSGFAELEAALRARLRAALSMEPGPTQEDMMQRLYPVVQLAWREGVKTRHGSTINCAELKQLDGEAGWAGPAPTVNALPAKTETPARPARRKRGERR